MNEPTPGRWIESMTWPEVELALGRFDTGLLPVGARCKEHGLHLPLNNDYLMAEYLARRVVEACPVLALPTVPYGHYPAFLEYPGSVSLSADTFRDTIADVCRSLARFGLRKFYVLNTGISTLPPLRAARELLLKEGVRLAYTDLRRTAAAVRHELETQPRGTHADEIETSVMLYLAPEVVRLDRAAPELSPDRGPGGLTRDPAAAGGVYSPSGAWGDPTAATREKGRRVVEAVVEEIVDFLRRGMPEET